MNKRLKEKLIYEKILDVSPDGFIIVDDKGYITDVNKAYIDFVKREKEQIIGRYITELIPNSQLPKVLKNGKTEIDVIHNLVDSANSTNEKVVAATRATIIDNGKVIGAFGQVKFSKGTRDLAKKLQQQEGELEYYKNELKKILGSKYTFESMIGKSNKFLAVKRVAEKAANNDFTVLILGDTGTGKEVFAHAIHHASNRSEKPFIRVNCAAIPNELLESELFGYEEGTFTGAKKGGRIGKFEMAQGGTIFLDEIGELPYSMQAKLLRVLQEREIEKIGSAKPTPIDVRVIAATNQNIEARIQENSFRADLYYRLNVIQLNNPPLRERSEDILLFTESFVQELNEKYGTRVTLTDECENILKAYTYPGNIRELKNIIESAYSLCDGDYILPSHLPANVIGQSKIRKSSIQQRNLTEMMDEIEREILMEVLKENNYNLKLSSEKLGVHRSTLYKKIEKLNMTIPR